jgi:3-deoxy-7-phosphoheptulonate synthase
MEPGAPEEQIQDVVERLEHYGFRIVLNRGDVMTVVAAIGDKRLVQTESIASMPGVRQILPIREPYKLAGRESQPHDTIIDLGHGVKLGTGYPLVVMAGPCSVEDNLEGLLKVARSVKNDGAQVLRGGAFKPRTSPYDFQGLEEKGLQYLAKAREETGLLVITEVMDSHDVDLVSNYADILQIGARNMQNFKLLKAVGKANKPVMLKRGPSANLREFLLAAEHILYQGNNDVILCERGIRSLDSNFTRNTLDLSAVPVIKKYSHLPIIVDPSHGTGQRYLVPPMAKAALASGADGLMIEVHHNPDKAYSDGAQSLTMDEFTTLMKEIKRLEEVLRPINAV